MFLIQSFFSKFTLISSIAAIAFNSFSSNSTEYNPLFYFLLGTSSTCEIYQCHQRSQIKISTFWKCQNVQDCYIMKRFPSRVPNGYLWFKQLVLMLSDDCCKFLQVRILFYILLVLMHTLYMIFAIMVFMFLKYSEIFSRMKLIFPPDFFMEVL